MKYTEYEKPIKVNVIGPGPLIRPGEALGKFVKPYNDGSDKIKIFYLVMSNDNEPFVTDARYVYPI